MPERLAADGERHGFVAGNGARRTCADARLAPVAYTHGGERVGGPIGIRQHNAEALQRTESFREKHLGPAEFAQSRGCRRRAMAQDRLLLRGPRPLRDRHAGMTVVLQPHGRPLLEVAHELLVDPAISVGVVGNAALVVQRLHQPAQHAQADDHHRLDARIDVRRVKFPRCAFKPVDVGESHHVRAMRERLGPQFLFEGFRCHALISLSHGPTPALASDQRNPSSTLAIRSLTNPCTADCLACCRAAFISATTAGGKASLTGT